MLKAFNKNNRVVLNLSLFHKLEYRFLFFYIYSNYGILSDYKSFTFSPVFQHAVEHPLVTAILQQNTNSFMVFPLQRVCRLSAFVLFMLLRLLKHPPCESKKN